MRGCVYGFCILFDQRIKSGTVSYTHLDVYKRQIRALLSARFSSYCEDLEKKGVEIIENDVKIYTGSKEARAQGTLTVLMPVGEAKPAVKTEIPLQEQSGEDADGNDGSSN